MHKLSAIEAIVLGAMHELGDSKLNKMNSFPQGISAIFQLESERDYRDRWIYTGSVTFYE